MTNRRATPRLGFMTDRPPENEGWWLASDGKWYPPESRPAPPPPSPQWSAPSPQQPAVVPTASMRSLSRGLTGTLVGFLWASAVTFSIAAIAYGSYWGTWKRWTTSSLGGTLSDLVEAEEVAVGAFGLAGIVFMVTAVLFLVWSHQAYNSALSLGATETRWASGWAVGGWFIPLANLIIPKLVLGEVERISDSSNGVPPIGQRWQDVRAGALSGWWWAFWVAATVMLWVASGIGSFVTTLTDDLFGAELAALTIACVAMAVSGVLGALFVSAIGRRLSRGTAIPATAAPLQSSPVTAADVRG